MQEAEKRLIAFKELVHKKFRARAKVLHPDVNPDVDEQAMKDLTQAKEMLLSIRIQDPRPMHGPQVIIIRTAGNYGGFTVQPGW